MCGAGITPGMLLWVTHWWSIGVIFNTRLAVGFHDFMMGLALVSCSIVMMGVSSITLCSSSCASSCLSSSTLCSTGIGGGVSRLLVQVPRVWFSVSPWEWYLLQQFAQSIHQWGHTGVDGESTQVIDNVVEINPSIQKYGKPLYLGGINGHIGNDLLKGGDRRHLHLGIPMSRGCPHLCTPPLCTWAGQAGICSNCMCHSKFCMPTLWDQFAMRATCWGCPGLEG